MEPGAYRQPTRVWGLAFGRGLTVAVGSGGAILNSEDGTAWNPVGFVPQAAGAGLQDDPQQASDPVAKPVPEFNDVAYNGRLFVSSYPDESWTGGVFTADDRERMLEFSFRHWKRHSPLSKLQLALTLGRAGRDADASLVYASVMDSAKTTRDAGTFWAPEDRAWLWYNDTIETHAFALRAMTELEPDDARRHGLVQWLLLNKELNHWKSTRATAEVVYSLVHYLDHEGQLAWREQVDVTAGPTRESFVFEPDRKTGQVQLLIPGPEVEAATMSAVVVEKGSPGFAFASVTWHYSTERLPAGEYTFKHRLRAAMAGTFRVAPATLRSVYAPEFAADSSGAVVEVAGE